MRDKAQLTPILLGLGGFAVSCRMIRYGATLLDVYTLAFIVMVYLTNRMDYIRELERRRETLRARWNEMNRLTKEQTLEGRFGNEK